ncbi:MAG TPA: hydroxymethylbilane synthase [Planctomycetota bacterium]|nr:hydroxymethylbilane synthase [Planctomycetota bacterium]
MTLRLGTRGSDLALWQARHVAARLAGRAEVEIVVLKTQGDRIDDVPLTQVEGKAFFTAEIERALLDRHVDLAVHSHKDLPTESPPGLSVVAVPARADASELLLARPEAHAPDAPLLPLRRGARVGTSSPRRMEQLVTLRPDLQLQPLRGNVPTRVARLREARHDAILLACAGVDRLALDLAGLHATRLTAAQLAPAPAQGALAIQIRAGESDLAALLRDLLHDEDAARAVEAERWLLAAAGGGCNLPLGAHVEGEGSGFRVHAFLGANHPRRGVRARWAEARGESPLAAAREVLARLTAGAPTGTGPLAGLRVALAGRAVDESGTEVGDRLVQLGARVRHEPVIELHELPAPDLPARLAALRPGDALAVTSRVAAARLAGLHVAEGVLVAAVGPATARALSAAGLRVDVTGDGGARELAARLALRAGATLLLPGAQDGRPELAEALAARGVRVERLALYRTATAAAAPPAAAVDARVYFSPSAVRACRELGLESPGAPRRVAWGDTTASVLRAAGLSCDGEARADVETLVQLLAASGPGVRAHPARSPEVPR